MVPDNECAARGFRYAACGGILAITTRGGLEGARPDSRRPPALTPSRPLIPIERRPAKEVVTRVQTHTNAERNGCLVAPNHVFPVLAAGLGELVCVEASGALEIDVSGSKRGLAELG